MSAEAREALDGAPGIEMTDADLDAMEAAEVA